MYHIVTIWRSTPLINKPWFVNPGLTLHKPMINRISGYHHFSSKPYAIICHLVCAMWMPRVIAAVITKALPGGEAYFWCFILMIRCWVLFFLQVTQLVVWNHGFFCDFPIILGMSSSQLTSYIFQRGWNHQPDKTMETIHKFLHLPLHLVQFPFHPCMFFATEGAACSAWKDGYLMCSNLYFWWLNH